MNLCFPNSKAMAAGARNLLVNCVGAREGASVLIIREPAAETYFDDAVADCVVNEARDMGLNVQDLTTDRIAGPDDIPSVVGAAVAAADHTIFLARLGDQMRFHPLPGPGTKTTCYVLDRSILGAEVCRIPYGLVQDVLEVLQCEIDDARKWHLTCPLGTDIAGSIEFGSNPPLRRSDFTVRLFPDGPIRPLDCSNAAGRVVTRWLPASATRVYDPFGLVLDEPVTLSISNGRIEDILGPETVVETVRRHYEHVGRLFKVDAWAVHSWHVGANPKIFSPWTAENAIERWNGVMHSHPRYAHFHTCGDYPPGEIVPVVVDPTVTLDGDLYWDEGKLIFLEREEVASLRDRYPGCESAFDMEMRIGL